jgi:hypothetical protein
METIKQYDVFELAKDINPNITKGMWSVILEVYSSKDFEVEFVNEDGTNYEFEGQSTFMVDSSFIGQILI